MPGRPDEFRRVQPLGVSEASRGAVRQPASIDALDVQIIEALQANGREPFRQMALKLGVSEATIRSRYGRLVDSDVLQVTAITNPLGLGYEGAIVGIVASGPVEPMADEISGWEEATYLVLIGGRFDVLVELMCLDRSHLLRVTDRIRSLPGVASMETFMYLELYKQLYSWRPRLSNPDAGAVAGRGRADRVGG